MTGRLKPEPGPRATQQHPGPGQTLPRGFTDTQLVDAGRQTHPAALMDEPLGRAQAEAQREELLGADNPALFGGEGEELIAGVDPTVHTSTLRT